MEELFALPTETKILAIFAGILFIFSIFGGLALFAFGIKCMYRTLQYFHQNHHVFTYVKKYGTTTQAIVTQLLRSLNTESSDFCGFYATSDHPLLKGQKLWCEPISYTKQRLKKHPMGRLKVGDTVNIQYDPNRPDCYYFPIKDAQTSSTGPNNGIS